MSCWCKSVPIVHRRCLNVLVLFTLLSVSSGDKMKHIVTSRVQLSSLKVHTDLYVDLQTLWASSCFHGAAYRGIIVTWYHCMETSVWGAIITPHWPRVLSQACCAMYCTTCVYGGHAVIWSVGLMLLYDLMGTMKLYMKVHTHTYKQNLPPWFCSSALHPPTWSGRCKCTCTFLLGPPDASGPNTSWQSEEWSQTRGKTREDSAGQEKVIGSGERE